MGLAVDACWALGEYERLRARVSRDCLTHGVAASEIVFCCLWAKYQPILEDQSPDAAGFDNENSGHICQAGMWSFWGILEFDSDV